MNRKNIKVFGFIGSMRGKKSIGYQTITKFLKGKEWNDAETQIEIITANQANINVCLGCCNCFNLGICPLETKDDMQQIKQKLLEADVIIISSPVYLHHLSGVAKTFLDRISHWAHTFNLIGKRVIVCSTTDTSGNEYVTSYLKKAMSSFGGLVVGELNVNLMKTEEELIKDFEVINNSLYESYKNPKACKVTSFQQQLFYTLKNIYLKNPNTYEAKYWKEHNLFEYLSFEDLLHEYLNKNS